MNISGMNLRKMVGVGVICAMVGLPATAAGSTGEEDRVVSYAILDRAEIENLQRWVAAGHEAWCKDARLVASEQLKRFAPDYEGDASELSATDPDALTEGANEVSFEWTAPDGRATYRVTVERFEWLLPIAKSEDAIVWIPTATEIQLTHVTVDSDDQMQLIRA